MTGSNCSFNSFNSIYKVLLTSLVFLMVSGSAYASSAICAAIENDPAARHLLAAPPHTLKGANSFTYKSVAGLDLRLHVFSPAEASAKSVDHTPQPAIIFFYGGAWEYGTVNEFIAPAHYFSQRGAVSILVDYRVFCRNGVSIADEISDAKSAVRYVRQHAQSLGVDPARIVVSGASAGGHLALSTAVLDGFEATTDDLTVSSTPNLLALFYPCSDVTTDDEKKYGGDAIGEFGHEASPFYHIRKNLPPMLIVQGTDDIVYLENKKFCAASQVLGNKCELVIYKGAAHGFFAPDVAKGKWYNKGLQQMDSALTKAGFLARR